MLKFGILGFGSRGRMFAELIRNDANAKLVAVADIAQSALDAAKDKFGIAEDTCFSSTDEFFACGKICDALFICTQDADHYDMVIKALNLGYDVCLEKPAAVTEEQCVDIRDTANRLGRKIMLTHVLRYAPFYQYIRRLIKDKTIGEVVTINQTENVAYWHF
ncbi:MAG: Gfo/Idh/MocA family protein, partial [Candidatus Fimimonas sp.]